MIGHRTSAVICNIRDERVTALRYPISDAPNLQRLVYDVDIATGATKCNPTQAHSAHEAVIKCRCMEAPLCGQHISSWFSSWLLSTQPSG